MVFGLPPTARRRQPNIIMICISIFYLEPNIKPHSLL